MLPFLSIRQIRKCGTVRGCGQGKAASDGSLPEERVYTPNVPIGAVRPPWGAAKRVGGSENRSPENEDYPPEGDEDRPPEGTTNVSIRPGALPARSQTRR